MALTKLTIDSYTRALQNEPDSVNKFYVKLANGKVWLTPYALRCGYLDVHKVKDGIFYIEDTMGEGYWVKSYRNKNTYLMSFWENFETLSEARKYVYNWKLRGKEWENVHYNWDKEEEKEEGENNEN